MTRDRVLVIGLDGFDPDYSEQLMARDLLPELRALRDRSASFLLDHGPAKRTGLAWEHFISGKTPEEAGRAAALSFDPQTYSVSQQGARFVPFVDSLDPARCVIFDAPYADLSRVTSTRGVVGWGAHDPGVPVVGRPPALARGSVEAYPARRWMYTTPWPSVEGTIEMGTELVRGVETRSRAACSLLTEQLPDWDLAIVVGGEPHSAAEAFWHGVDPEHPLHSHPSAPHAARALEDVYRAMDRLVGDLVSMVGADTVLAFSMGGMGPNHSDVPCMVLLPELLFRWAGHDPLLTLPTEWHDPREVPILPATTTWAQASATWYPLAPPPQQRKHALRDALPSELKRPLRSVKHAWRRLVGRLSGPPRFELDISWQPATRYARWWSEMPAFALPSFYDGRIRINLRGRERDGVVDESDYDDVCDELERLVRDTRDPRTGESVVDGVDRPGRGDPVALNETDADLVIVWRGGPCALEHPDHGTIGPVPFRRTGGHTGRFGFAYLAAPEVAVGDQGIRSAFDVAPTVVELSGHEPLEDVCGTSLVAAPARAGRSLR